ncbi:3-isopropylmalate dehydratase [Tistrella mobilis]|jgi:3-isopropylmalate/(R)-2-methylmalate dehydratase small subunit|uniref:3-isopropylmalate dehydratase, small subunit n=2 Tax=Tistrella mobilis TaxID=171437 RepID=I3TL48_TISMK|nr:3-isopropylmalate dehydratase [Tistrella mobilis]AFK53486.1 3-isopropylmalate dehydratase, small subunit [Tistrella mobilis KA081020-065]
MSLPDLRGRAVWVFREDDYDIDRIIGVENIKITDIDALAALVMKDDEPGFPQKVRPGDLLVGADNFGYGHPHYPAMRAMRHLGVAGVIADGFSPGFWRGEISMGFPLIPCPGVAAATDRFDSLEVDWQAGCVRNLTRGWEKPFEPLSVADRAMLEAGGLVPYLKRAVDADRARTGG